MKKSVQWTFRNLPPELRDVSTWPKMDVSGWTQDEQTSFFILQNAIEAYLKTGKLTQICLEIGMSKAELLRHLNRCLASASNGMPYGWTALIRGKRVKRHVRKDLPKGGPGTAKGFSGAFELFLEMHSKIKEAIDELILKEKKNGRVHEARISVDQLHNVFVDLCRQENVLPNQYPLNTESQGARSLGRYRKRVIYENLHRGTRAASGKEASDRLRLGTGNVSHRLRLAPYDLVGMDGHKIDCIGTVRIIGPAGPQRVVISRLWIVPVFEHASKAILGYSVGIQKEIDAATAENAVKSALSNWQPRQLKVPGMQYCEGAGFPSYVIPQLAGVAWGVFTIDNAAIHYSVAISQRLHRRVGCAITWIPIGQWDHHAALERLMRSLEIYGFQRLPSTTGSSPTDTKKDEPARKAVELGIDYEVLLDLVDVILAEYNAKKTEGVGSRSPLDFLRESLSDVDLDFLPRILPPPTFNQVDLGVIVHAVTIRGDARLGRRPYIQLDRVRYTSPILASAMGLIGKKVRFHVQEGEYHLGRAYLESGEDIGVLNAQGGWGNSPHTRAMRKTINALLRSKKLNVKFGCDVIQAYMAFLSSAAHKDAEKNPLKVSVSATKLAHASYVTGNDIPPAQVVMPLLSEPRLEEIAIKPSSMTRLRIWKTITE